MSVNVPTWYVEQFASNIQTLLQQKGSILRPYVNWGTYTGKQGSPVEQIGAITAQRVSGRFQPMPRVDATTDRRWVFPNDYDLPQLLDNFDLLRLIVDPKGVYTTNALYAMGRALDDEIIAAFSGTAKTGEQGGTSVTFGTNVTTAGTPGNNVAVAFGAAAATNMTVAKLREAKRRLRQNLVDMDDPITVVMTSKEMDNLLSEVQVVSTDFNDRPVLVDGQINRFLGMNFVSCERLTTGTDDASGTSTQCFAFAKSGMHGGMWNEISTSVSTRNDLRGNPYQVYAYGTFGATRLEENKIVRIWCR
jgi:hypothetical protein